MLLVFCKQRYWCIYNCNLCHITWIIRMWNYKIISAPPHKHWCRSWTYNGQWQVNPFICTLRELNSVQGLHQCTKGTQSSSPTAHYSVRVLAILYTSVLPSACESTADSKNHIKRSNKSLAYAVKSQRWLNFQGLTLNIYHLLWLWKVFNI